MYCLALAMESIFFLGTEWSNNALNVLNVANIQANRRTFGKNTAGSRMGIALVLVSPMLLWCWSTKKFMWSHAKLRWLIQFGPNLHVYWIVLVTSSHLLIKSFFLQSSLSQVFIFCRANLTIFDGPFKQQKHWFVKPILHSPRRLLPFFIGEIKVQTGRSQFVHVLLSWPTWYHAKMPNKGYGNITWRTLGFMGNGYEWMGVVMK